MSTRTVAVVTAGLSQPSTSRLLADRLATATERGLGARGHNAVVELFELREHAHAITNNLLTGFPGEELQQVVDSVRGADALIVVSPIFNASYSGLFKSFFDVIEAGSLDAKPVLIGATGGTARHSLALEFAMRPLFAYARASVVPTAVFAAAEDWGDGDASTGLAARIERAADELVGLVLGSHPSAPADPFDDVTPFARLLSGEG
ncbi:FMN reductase [Lapillicoccus sp.]|uniref:FMN reductase n=1 Tax=Lapillicoccus sp. TaxID=1909287 RepID=UPI00398363B7